MTAVVLLGAALVALAAWDIASLAARRLWRDVVVVAALWLVAITMTLVRASGVELPTVSQLVITLARPVARWVP